MSQNQKNSIDNPLGEHTNDSGHESYGKVLNELIAFKAKVQILEAREEALEKKLQESQDESTLLKENYQKEIVELKMKNQKMTEEFEEKIKKLEKIIQKNEQKIGEAENEIMESIREMKVQLPLENWHDLLAFVPRSQIGNVVSQIGDRQFARIIQSFLHDPVREITLGSMDIIRPRWNVPSDQTMVEVRFNAAANIPDWPMPANIKDFKEIHLRYVDISVLNFLGKFQENSLFESVNLYVDYGVDRYEEDTLLQVLTRIVPLISSIHSIQIYSQEIDLFRMAYNNNDNWDEKTQMLLKEMMARTRILLIHWHLYGYNYDEFKCSWEDKVDWYCSWLYTPRNDGKPRMLRSYSEFYGATDCACFIERIKKDFKMANHSVSFFIHTRIRDNDNVEDFSIENVKTNEKLVITTESDDPWKVLLISRYPLKAAKSWIEANANEISAWNNEKLNRKINMNESLRMAM